MISQNELQREAAITGFQMEPLTEDPDLQLIILNHPGLLWKAQNVREHFRRGSHDANIPNQNQLSQKESGA